MLTFLWIVFATGAGAAIGDVGFDHVWIGALAGFVVGLVFAAIAHGGIGEGIGDAFDGIGDGFDFGD